LVAFDGLSCLAGLFLFHLRKKKEEKKEEKYCWCRFAKTQTMQHHITNCDKLL
jgi:hypothetical protein